MSSISALNKTLNEEKMRFHDELNPSIWEGNKLKDKVAMKLMEIASNFVAYLDVEGFSIEDIIITGSMANYNYTEQSDIDLHIICDYSKLPTNCPILSQEYFQAKKKIYNDKHNIKIYGYDVELYVEDSSVPSLAGGKYSLLQRKWLRFPQKIDFEVDDVIGTEELQDLITQIENVCMTDGNIEEANDLLNRIYEMRKSGLAKGGEFAFENLLFKALRNRGYLDKLRSYIAYAEDLSLSLNESVEYIEGIEVLINPTKQELNGFMKKNKVYRVLLTDNDMAIWTADCSLCHLDVEGEYPEFNNSEHLFALNGNLFFVDYDMQPEEIEDFYFEDAEKLDNLPIVKEYFPHSQMKKALEMMKNGISMFNAPSDWYGWLGESYSFLTEGISDLAKQFPRIPEEKLRKFIALDPTYKGGEQAGKYGSWIIRLFYNNIKNADRMAQYREFYQQNNGINPKTGEVIQKPELLPQTPYEDAEKIPPLLKQYEVLKKEIGKPIDSFKSIQDLYTAIQQHTQKGVPQDKEALERYNVFKTAEEKGLKEIYDDNDWIIGIPTTFESSKPFGQYTNWCTTSSGGSYYDRYLNQYGGEYYILLNKKDGSLYQFHFESNQFMDETDSSINMDAFTQAFGNIAKFLYEYKSKNGGSQADVFNKLKEKFVELLKNPEQLQKEVFSQNYVQNLVVNGDTISGRYDIDSLSEYVYDKNERDGLTMETVCKLLTDYWSMYNYYDDNLRDYSYQAGDWNAIAKKYGIEEYNWDKICNIYEGDEEVNSEIESLIQDDFYDGNGLLSFCSDCALYGSEAECHKDIMYDLKDNLPISVDWVEEGKWGTETEFSLSKDELWKVFYVMNKKTDVIPDFNTKMDNTKESNEMSEKWYKTWGNDAEDYGYDMEAFEDWIYCWRVANGKCDAYEFSNGAFVVDEPRYGWSGFDDELFKEGCESAAKRIAEILGKTEKKVANESVEDNRYDDYDQILADLENAELTLRNGNQRQKYVNVINKYLAKVGSNIAELSWTGDFIDKVGTKEAQKAVNELYESFNKAEEKPKNLNEEIVYASKKDLSDIILKNPTRKEILEYDNPLLKHQDWRIAKDNNGNYYFGSGYDWIHFEMCDALKKQGIDIDVVFADYDGIASYDSKTNTFYIRDEYGEPELIEQEFNNSYLKKAFPNAKLEIDAEYDEMLESKQLTESIMFNDEVYDDFQEEYRQLTVWVNPSVDWIRSKLDEAGGFRFLHSLDKNKLYVFTVKSGFMHQQVFDMLDFDWSKNGRNVVGVFNPDNSISIWEALADDGEASSSLKLAEELDNDLFKQIYPNGYELTICY